MLTIAKQFIISFFPIFVIFQSNAQDAVYEWAYDIGVDEKVDRGRSITLDKFGNVYSTGFFSGINVDFDPGVGIFNLSSSYSSSDIYITKTDRNKNLIWAKKIGSGTSDQGHSITIDSSGFVYVTGAFTNSVDFDPGPGTFLLNSTSGSKMFLLKLDSDGQFIWAVAHQGSGSSEGSSVKLDSFGNIFVCGSFKNTVDMDPGPETYPLTTSVISNYENTDIFIQKFDPQGNFVWAKRLGNTESDQASALSIAEDGSILAVGSYRYTTDFDPGPGNFPLGSTANPSIFILKLDTDGNFVWAKKIGTELSSYASDIKSDSEGNLYISGHYSDTIIDLDPGINEYIVHNSSLAPTGFLVKLDPNGDLIWGRTFIGGSTLANSLDLDHNQNIYLTGDFTGTVNFYPELNWELTSTMQLNNLYVLKLDGNGVPKWVKNFPNGISRGMSIVANDNNEIYTTGYFTTTVDFNPGAAINSLTTNTHSNIFILKLQDVDCSPEFFNSTLITCEDSLVWIDGHTYSINNSNAVLALTNSLGCDSVITANIEFLPKFFTTNTHIIDGCDSIFVGNHIYTSPGTYLDTFNTINGCDSIIQTQLILTNESNFDLTISINELVLSSNQSDVLYQWINCDNNYEITGATNQNFTPVENGQYAVVLTSPVSCFIISDTSECISIQNLNIETQLNTNFVSTFPNPTNDLVYFSSSLNIQKIEFFDLNGKMIEISANVLSNGYVVDLSLLENGIYFAKISLENNYTIKKIVKTSNQ